MTIARGTIFLAGIFLLLRFDAFRTVLQLRAEIEGNWGGNPPPPDSYYDAKYYDLALATLKQ